MSDPTSAERRSGAQSVARALAVLKCFEASAGELGVSEIARQAGLTVSTSHRLARALCAEGLLTQNPATERYQLGPAVVVLGRRAEEQLGYGRALPTLSELAAATGESVNLGIRAGHEVLVVLDVPSGQPLRFQQELGSRVPIHTSAMGKCLLAYDRSATAEIEGLALTALTDRTITARDDLLTELEHTRERGWALNDEERNPGVRAVAVPVLDAGGHPAAAVAVQGPAQRMSDDRLDGLAALIVGATTDLAPLLAATA